MAFNLAQAAVPSQATHDLGSWTGTSPETGDTFHLKLEESAYTQPITLESGEKFKTAQVIGILKIIKKNPGKKEENPEIIHILSGRKLENEVILQKTTYDLDLVLGVEMLTFKIPGTKEATLTAKHERVSFGKSGISAKFADTQASTLQLSRVAVDKE